MFNNIEMGKQKMVPDNVEGKELNLEKCREFSDPGEADQAYQRAVLRLLSPNDWQELCGKGSAGFRMRGSQGEEIDRPLREGDLLQIDVPGPGPAAGEGFDWVEVVKIDSDHAGHKGYTAVKLMPAKDPQTKRPSTAHFFRREASSTLMVCQNGLQVVANYYGRNEQINNSTGKPGDDIRNTLVGLGARVGGSKWQWVQLIESFLSDHPA